MRAGCHQVLRFLVNRQAVDQTFQMIENPSYFEVFNAITTELDFLQSVIQMGGFRSLADDEEVEFKADKSNKGWEAVEVRGCEGSDCRGSHRRPGAKKS